MSKSRINQIASMYSYIMNVPEDEALKAIISTPTGKEISKRNPTYLYNQPTSNLSVIVAELPAEVRSHFSKQRIIQAANAVYYSAPRKVAAAPELKTVQTRKLKHLNSLQLQKYSSLRIANKGGKP